MNINELKVGDRVNFETIGYSPMTVHRKTGVIEEIKPADKIHGSDCVCRTDDGQRYGARLSSISHKLEPFPIQYKETKIEHEKESQFISYCDGCKRTFVVNKEIKLNATFFCDNCRQVFERMIERLKEYVKGK